MPDGWLFACFVPTCFAHLTACLELVVEYHCTAFDLFRTISSYLQCASGTNKVMRKRQIKVSYLSERSNRSGKRAAAAVRHGSQASGGGRLCGSAAAVVEADGRTRTPPPHCDGRREGQLGRVGSLARSEIAGGGVAQSMRERLGFTLKFGKRE